VHRFLQSSSIAYKYIGEKMKYLALFILAAITVTHGASNDYQRSLARHRILDGISESPTVSPAPSTAMVSALETESPTVSPAPSTEGKVSLVSLFGSDNPPPPKEQQNSIFGFNVNNPPPKKEEQNSIFGFNMNNNPPPKKEDPKKNHPNSLQSPWRNPGFTRSADPVTITVLVVSAALGSFLGLTL
jgi:hypothetical protein